MTDEKRDTKLDQLKADISAHLASQFVGPDAAWDECDSEAQWIMNQVQAFYGEQIEKLEAERDEYREALKFYAEWEEKSADAFSKTYDRTYISVNYPGPSKASEVLKKWGGKA